MKKNITKKQEEALNALYESIKETGFPPTLADLRERLNVASNQSVLNFLGALEKKGLVGRVEGQARSIKISPLGLQVLGKGMLVPALGVSAAGSVIETLEQDSFQWLPLPGKFFANESLTKSSENLYIIQIRGDSMINAGISDGDMLLVKESKEYKSKDIVVAKTDEGTTVKRFIADGGKRYLKPENPAYQNIPIIPGEVKFQGKVILNLSKVQ